MCRDPGVCDIDSEVDMKCTKWFIVRIIELLLLCYDWIVGWWSCDFLCLFHLNAGLLKLCANVILRRNSGRRVDESWERTRVVCSSGNLRIRNVVIQFRMWFDVPMRWSRSNFVWITTCCRLWLMPQRNWRNIFCVIHAAQIELWCTQFSSNWDAIPYYIPWAHFDFNAAIMSIAFTANWNEQCFDVFRCNFFSLWPNTQ